jgi:hypothetical protein
MVVMGAQCEQGKALDEIGVQQGGEELSPQLAEQCVPHVQVLVEDEIVYEPEVVYQSHVSMVC